MNARWLMAIIFFIILSSFIQFILLRKSIFDTLSNNYIPKIKEDGSFKNSIMYDTGERIGIGTANPRVPFHVVGDLMVEGRKEVNSGNPGLAVKSENGNGIWSLAVEQVNNGRVTLYDWLTEAIPFSIEKGAPSGALHINPNGYVGVGTFEPKGKLEVAGGMMLNPSEEKPVCDNTIRGMLWFTKSLTNTKDELEICIQAQKSSYKWMRLY